MGEVGEIAHRSPHLHAGDTSTTPSAPGAAFEGDWFHSGDLRSPIDDEGYITVVDRKKDMIKTGG
ncbi:MAG: AMP-binding protein, partial [Agrobacterium sp.]|nr:AMP-binding protein [Agrobacterium sp.]